MVLAGFYPGTSLARQRAIEHRVGIRWVRHLGGQRGAIGSDYLLGVPSGQELRVVQALSAVPAVRFAELDYVLHASGTQTVPNDPSFALQWGSQNTGQNVNGITGTAGADDHAVAAWGVSTGSRSVVVGEVDTGVDYGHPDLANNIWSNPGGIGGCAAGTHGYNVVASTCNPMDDDTAYGGHGTHVAGIIGASGNNGIGVAGMNWNTTILPVKWLDSSASGTTDQLISALSWVLQAKQAGVNVQVVNDSATFVGTAYSQALSDEIDTLGSNGILFVTAAGNTGDDNDNLKYRRYPCGYDRPTEICVTASDQHDLLPSWANYGASTVDLAAPGDNIFSTLRNGTYGYISGGSMAAGQVSGAAALILSVTNLGTTALKADILNNVDPLPSLSGLVRTGGRLDVCKAIPGCSTQSSTSTTTSTTSTSDTTSTSTTSSTPTTTSSTTSTTSSVPSTGTFGNATVGSGFDTFAANRKRVNAYSLTNPASVTKLSIYLAATSTTGTADLQGLIYSDSNGQPATLLGTTQQLAFSNSQSTGWYDLPFTTPVNLPAGRYWIGVITGATSGVASFRYQTVSNSRDYNSNTYTSGPTNPFGSFSTDNEQMSLYATYTSGSSGSSPPSNSSPPTITGTAQMGQTLSASPGSWTGSPTAYAYQWERCDSSGASCVAISGASTASYTVQSADGGSTLVVAVRASNSSGTSSPAFSAPTSVVPASTTTSTTSTSDTTSTSTTSSTPTTTSSTTSTTSSVPSTGTFGNATVGSGFDTFAANRKRVNAYSLTNPASVTKLSIYLAATSTTGTADLQGLIYSDSNGQPATLLGTTQQLAFSNSQSTGWYDLPFTTPVNLPAGRYWIGVITGATSGVASFRYQTVSNSRDYNSNTYTSGPTNPFGSFSTDNEQMSLYATYG